jgi:hypothetical protein
MSLNDVVQLAGATDLFVFHRVTDHDLVNLGGHGRGAGWAGNIELDPAEEPWLAELVEKGSLRARSTTPRRLVGPYWASEAAGIDLGDHVIVMGGPGTSELNEARLREAAEMAAAQVTDVPAEKRLADELEIAQAALSVATLPRKAASATEIAAAAARASGCEFGAVLLFGPPMKLYLAEDGWRPPGTDEEIIAALLPLGEAITSGLHIEQDASESSYPYRPLSAEDGLVARCVVPIGNPRKGLLLVAHSSDAPRGFTMLCQRVLGAVASAAAPVLADT